MSAHNVIQNVHNVFLYLIAFSVFLVITSSMDIVIKVVYRPLLLLMLIVLGSVLKCVRLDFMAIMILIPVLLVSTVLCNSMENPQLHYVLTVLPPAVLAST